MAVRPSPARSPSDGQSPARCLVARAAPSGRPARRWIPRLRSVDASPARSPLRCRSASPDRGNPARSAASPTADHTGVFTARPITSHRLQPPRGAPGGLKLGDGIGVAPGPEQANSDLACRSSSQAGVFRVIASPRRAGLSASSVRARGRWPVTDRLRQANCAAGCGIGGHCIRFSRHHHPTAAATGGSDASSVVHGRPRRRSSPHPPVVLAIARTRSLPVAGSQRGAVAIHEGDRRGFAANRNGTAAGSGRHHQCGRRMGRRQWRSGSHPRPQVLPGTLCGLDGSATIHEAKVARHWRWQTGEVRSTINAAYTPQWCAPDHVRLGGTCRDAVHILHIRVKRQIGWRVYGASPWPISFPTSHRRHGWSTPPREITTVM